MTEPGDTGPEKGRCRAMVDPPLNRAPRARKADARRCYLGLRFVTSARLNRISLKILRAAVDDM